MRENLESTPTEEKGEPDKAVEDTTEAVNTAVNQVLSGNKGERYQGRLALKRMGPKAEPVVRELLASPSELVVLTACDLLDEIGTADSLPALRTVADDPAASRGVRIEATTALEAIQKRGR